MLIQKSLQVGQNQATPQSTMNQIFEALFSSAQAAPYANDLSNRQVFTVLAAVANNNDPDGLRRIRCTDPVNPNLETHWLRRATHAPGLDAQLPQIGETVRVTFIEGDPSSGFYDSAVNLVNPPLDKADPVSDTYEALRGDRTTTIAKSDLTDCTDSSTLKVGKTIRLENFAGAFIELSEDGSVTISNGTVKLELNGSAMAISGATSLSVNGKEILSLGSVDSDGDVSVSRGW